MRLKVTAAALAAALCLCSCSSGSSTKPCELDEKFTSQVKMIHGDKQYTASLTRADAQIWQIEFAKPETVSGLKLCFSGDICTLELEGLKYELERSSVSRYSPAALCCGALEELISMRGMTCTKDGGTVTEKGSTAGQDFTAVFKDGKIKELTFDSQLRCEF